MKKRFVPVLCPNNKYKLSGLVCRDAKTGRFVSLEKANRDKFGKRKDERQ